MADDETDLARQRMGATFGFAHATLWVVAGVLTGIAVEFSINATPALLEVVSRHRAVFVTANVIGVAAQLALPGFLIGLAALFDHRRPSVALGIGLWALSAPAFIVSSGFHAIFGHIPAQIAASTPDRVDDELIRDADVLHHLGDFSYFVGVLIVTAALAALLPALRSDGRFGRTVAVVAVITIICSILQFGWLIGIDPLENLGMIGILGQVTVVIMLSRQMLVARSGR